MRQVKARLLKYELLNHNSDDSDSDQKPPPAPAAQQVKQN